MTDAELLLLLKGGESDRVERKEALTSGSAREAVAQAICAFANDLPNHGQPGVVFIGVTDKGDCAGTTITEQVLQTLAGMRSEGNILPPPVMTIRKTNLDGCELGAAIVEPAIAPPVRYKGQVWIRVGPRRGIATEQEERRLIEKRRFRDLPFELHPVTTAETEDLDLELFRTTYLPAAVAPEIVERNSRTNEQQLASLRFVEADPPHSPTVLGLLVCGKSPGEFIGGAYVQFLRVDGRTLADAITDGKEIVGPLPTLLLRLDEIFEANIHVAVDVITGPIELKRPDYPLPALQQIARNAVLHRSYEGTNAPVRITWYSDRIEIQNPGGPYGQVTKENFGRAGLTDYRNRHLAEAMKLLGFIQRFGVGIQIARDQLQQNGNPPLEFEVEDTHVLCRVRAAG